MNRLNQIKTHLSAAAGLKKAEYQQKNSDDVVIVLAYRTPIARGKRGSFKDLKAEDVLYGLLSEYKKKNEVDFSRLEDVACGNVLNPGAGANEFRAAALAAGVPYHVPFVLINRQCLSGLMSVNYIANQIRTGQISVGLAAGVESMSTYFGPQAAPQISDRLLDANSEAEKCLIPMGITNENIAKKFDIGRPTQDEFAAKLYAKAEAAIEAGLFDPEIIPIPVETEEGVKLVARDEGVRKGTSYETLSKLKPSFIPKVGTTHAGNSSQVSDGAALVVLARRSVAEELGLPIVGKYIMTQVVGVPPEIMGVGPAYAIPKLLNITGLTNDDITVFEINEAFAAQCLYSVQSCGIPEEKVNPRGGAIALGHPLGCTGARLVATVLNELKPGEIGVTSMCIGSGMGAAAAFVKE